MDWGWDLVAGKFDIAQQMVVKGWVGEGVDRLGDFRSRRFDWDIIVLFEVDASLLLERIVDDSEEVSLNAWIGWACDVLAIDPLAIA